MLELNEINNKLQYNIKTSINTIKTFLAGQEKHSAALLAYNKQSLIALHCTQNGQVSSYVLNTIKAVMINQWILY